MRIAILGGTGRSGRLLLDKALAAGHEVTVLARRPESLGTGRPGLRVVQGDIRDRDAVRQTLAGAEAVISVLGPRSNDASMAVSEGMALVLEAMQESRQRRLIMTAGAGVGDPRDAPRLIHRLINLALRLAAKNVLADMSRAVSLVRDSDLDWTVVRVPMLSDASVPGTVKAGYVCKEMGSRIGRAELSDFLLAQLGDASWYRASPVISV